MRRLALAALLLPALLAGCAHTPPDDPSDPFEGVNRGVFAFNRTADRYVLRPVAKGYDAVAPSPVRTGIRNFFANLGYPVVVINDVLQAKFRQGGADLSRFVINSTFGIAGIFDVAGATGLPANDEDFGQTLGYWGVGEGAYLMLPLLGPSDGRDLFGRAGDTYASPLSYVNPEEYTYAGNALQAVELRAQLLDADSMLDQQIDPYVFVRSIYLQGRLAKVYDGNPPKEDFGFED